MNTPHAGAGAQNCLRIVQVVGDFARQPLSALRILDLGAYEGGIAISLASLGAQVVAVEGRPRHVAKMEFARDALGLQSLRIVQADIRALDRLGLGSFDVVCCLGVLYHMPAEDARTLLNTTKALCRHFMIIETQIALRATATVRLGELVYQGRFYPENAGDPGAALESGKSFWFTRSSLMRLIHDTGFTSVSEVVAPAVPSVAIYRDHLTLLAAPGKTYRPTVLSHVDPATITSASPGQSRLGAHPSQGWIYAVADRWRRRRGAGLAAILAAPGTAEQPRTPASRS